MENQHNINHSGAASYSLLSAEADVFASELIKPDVIKNLLEYFQAPGLGELLKNMAETAGKKSFLVCQGNKYVNVLTKNIAFFTIKYNSSVITCLDGKEYFIKYSLDQIQSLLHPKAFFRLNRQCLINFHAVLEVEHYYSRKLLVIPIVAVKEKFKVPKEKVSEFLRWLDNR